MMTIVVNNAPPYSTIIWCILSGKLTKNYGKSQFCMGKLTISMAIFNSFFYVYQRVIMILVLDTLAIIVVDGND